VDVIASRRICLCLEFEGAEFCGWQLQSETHESAKPSIQAWIEKALQIALRSQDRIVVQGCGRTDAGVSAENFFAHFDIPESILFEFDDAQLEKLRHSLNGILPDAIGVKSCQAVANDFHALKNVSYKVYQYTLCVRRCKPVLARRTSYWIPENLQDLDLDALQEALKCFEGEHDFCAFTPTDTEVQSTKRKVLKTEIKKEGDLLSLSFYGQGFLRYQVRNMAGTLIEVARSKRKASSVKELLEQGSSRTLSGFCAPPEGLLLKEVHYS
jgi:tRNA pseudouridine38-40 synthase